jgi:hypothetical protein
MTRFIKGISRHVLSTVVLSGGHIAHIAAQG